MTTAPPPPQVTLRPVTDADMAFLAQVYAATRQEELAHVPWSAPAKAAFLDSQFHAQHTYYAQQFRGAEFSVVVVDGESAGRLYLDRRPDEFRIIDIALLPAHRGRGIGTRLLGDVLAQAGNQGVAVTIHVEQFNPARALYQRLGFCEVAQDGAPEAIYVLMRWGSVATLPAAAQANTAS